MNEDSRHLARFVRRLEELHTWRNASEHPIRRWTFATKSGVKSELDLGEPWPVVDLPVRFGTETTVPEGWAGEPVELELWLGGGGLRPPLDGRRGRARPVSPLLPRHQRGARR